MSSSSNLNISNVDYVLDEHWMQIRLNRLITDYLLREGNLITAKQLVEDMKINVYMKKPILYIFHYIYMTTV